MIAKPRLDYSQKFVKHLGACILCGKDEWVYYGGREHFGIRVEYWICPKCTLVAQSPRFDDDYISEFYSSQYRNLYEGSPDVTVEQFELQQQRGRGLLDYASTFSNRRIKTLLDFGSSAGGLLSVTSERGIDCAIGVEVDNKYATFALQRGYKTFSSLGQLTGAGFDKFDLITISHVLEHVSDPLSLLEELSGLLAENGLLCLEVPNSVDGGCFELAHLWGFNRASLSKILRKVGLRTLNLESHGSPRQPERKTLYLRLIASRSSQFPGEIYFGPKPVVFERMQYYLNRRPDASPIDYFRLIVKNSVKHMLKPNRTPLVADSLWPTRLRNVVKTNGK